MTEALTLHVSYTHKHAPECRAKFNICIYIYIYMCTRVCTRVKWAPQSFSTVAAVASWLLRILSVPTIAEARCPLCSRILTIRRVRRILKSQPAPEFTLLFHHRVDFWEFLPTSAPPSRMSRRWEVDFFLCVTVCCSVLQRVAVCCSVF